MGYSPFGLTGDADAFSLERRDHVNELGTLATYGNPRAERYTHLFLHGISLNWSAWTPLLQAAAHRGIDSAGWLFVDLPGFGGSSPPKPGVTLGEIGWRVGQAIADAWRVTQVHVVGHSMGGFLALDMGSRHASGIGSLTVFNGTYASIVDTVNRPFHALVNVPVGSMIYQGLRLATRLPIPARLAHTPPAVALAKVAMSPVAAHSLRLPDSLVRTMAVESRTRSFSTAESTGTRYDYRAAWRRIGVPTRLVYGPHDRLVSRRDMVLAQECMPHAEVVLVPDSGHLTPIERPFEALDMIGAT